MGKVTELHSDALQRAGVANLTEWAIRLNYDTGRVLAAPSAALVPAPVKALVSELAALVGLLAREVDRLRAAGK